jgi:hypothetical protein
MLKHRALDSSQTADLESVDWQPLPGGELEGRRPKVMCPSCRETLRALARRRADRSRGGEPDAVAPTLARSSGERKRTLCFECYRTDLARERAVRSIVSKLTSADGVGSAGWDEDARLQAQLPFEVVDRTRLGRLRAERARARRTAGVGTARFVDKRRHAQIAARHALQRIAEGLQPRTAAAGDALHAAELQLPEAWLPFVGAR